MSNNIQSICVLAVVALFASSSPLSGEVVSVDMFVDPFEPANTMELEFSATFLTSGSDTDSSNLMGNVLADLQIVFDPNTHDVSQITGLEFTGGTIDLTEDTVFELDFSILGDIDAIGTNISGTLDTPDPPQPVSGTTFNASEHQLILNNGDFDVAGTGTVGGLFDPFTFYFSTDPAVSSNTGTGTILISLLSVDGHTATYQITLTMPVDFNKQIFSNPSITMELYGVGSLMAQGQFSRCTLRADLTGDCHVYWEDLVEFCRQWLASDGSVPCPLTADFTADDCHVDLFDFAILVYEWLQ